MRSRRCNLVATLGNRFTPSQALIALVKYVRQALQREPGDTAVPDCTANGPRHQIAVLPCSCVGWKQELIDVTLFRIVVDLELVVRTGETSYGCAGVPWRRRFCLLRQIGTAPLHVVRGRQLQNVKIFRLDIDAQLLRARDDKGRDGISKTEREDSWLKPSDLHRTRSSCCREIGERDRGHQGNKCIDSCRC